VISRWTAGEKSELARHPINSPARGSRMNVGHRWREWLRSAEGATAVEYAFMASLIALAIVGTVLVLGQTLNVPFQSVVDGL
jgi:Flp pilus assembly pilin Flp